MEATQTDPKALADWALVLELGGPSRVAEMLGYTVQRIQNWKARGIPADEKLKRPDLFLPQFKAKRQATKAE
jgi:hypothetical protein